MINGLNGLLAKDQQNTVKLELGKIIEACENLSNDEKAQLLKHLVGNDSGLSLVVGGSQVNANTVYQINLADREQVGDILKAIASRIEGEASRKAED
jgi:hypothetical protein